MIDAIQRLIDMPAESAGTVRKILAPHLARSIQRIGARRTVLAIQDELDLSFVTRPGRDGLEVLDTNESRKGNFGLHVHATLAVTDSGPPLGVLRLGFDARKARPPEALERRKARRWLDGFAGFAKAMRDAGIRTRRIAVCDWEADCFELFDTQRGNPWAELLVHARRDHELGKGQQLFDVMRADGPVGFVAIEIDGQKPAGRKRLAHCDLRFRKVWLPPTKTAERLAPAMASAVHVVETAAPGGEEPVQWRLLTTLDVRSMEEAADIVGCYLQRSTIKDFFRVLKTGCRTEFLPFRTANRLQRAITINAVIAWRIMAMIQVGRQTPDYRPEIMFADHELDFLRNYAREHGLAAPDQLCDAMHLVAHLGGHRARKRDPAPGRQIMWHGQTRLTGATLGHRVGFEAGRRHALQERGGEADAVTDLL